MYKIGIVGNGFVGGAVAQGFSLHADVKIYDKYKKIGSMEEVSQQEFIFVCVPTNVVKDGSQDLSVVEDVISSIKNECIKNNNHPIVLIKSTCLPGTTRMLSEKYKLRMVYNPEFLTARNARLDFINAARIVIGGEKLDLIHIEELYRCRFPSTPIFKTSFEGAELVKYMANCFFALKISYMNEIYDICDKFNISFRDMKNMFLSDGRIGNSHCDVPGHDGDRGFGGTCFPKDLKSFITWAEKNNLNVETLKAAHGVNNRVRNLIDWIEEDK